jgi:hypothetical protein
MLVQMLDAMLLCYVRSSAGHAGYANVELMFVVLDTDEQFELPFLPISMLPLFLMRLMSTRSLRTF